MVDSISPSKGLSRPKRSLRRPVNEQRISSYMTFGSQVTLCLGIFLGVYALLLLGLSPLLTVETPTQTHLKRGEALKPVVAPLVDKMKYMPQVPGKQIASDVASAIKSRLHNLRKSEGISDEELLMKAAEEMKALRASRKGNDAMKENIDNPMPASSDKRAGFVVLGMHRSGTSMLSGLLVTGAGYNVGSPLIGGAFDNEKGFFERVDAVLQNDAFMDRQQIWWSANVVNYDADKALEDKKTGAVKFKEGEKALKFLNNPANAPWLQKDPRMCITLKTWLPLLTSQPAAVFTYRHPLEVAMSLKKREKNFTVDHGLRLWIVYNMRAIQNSASLCRVLSSNEQILADPLSEVQRISDELTVKCGVPSPPQKITQEDVDKFVDPDLQHNKKKREEEEKTKKVLADNDGCIIREYQSELPEGSSELSHEQDLYMKSMKVYCDLQNGKAYESHYQWPKLS